MSNVYLWKFDNLEFDNIDAVLVPFLNYSLHKYIGEKFVAKRLIKNTPSNAIYSLQNIENGENINSISPSEIFTCIDIEFIEGNYSTVLAVPMLILKSSNGNSIRVAFYNELMGASLSDVGRMFRPNIYKDFVTLSQKSLLYENQKNIILKLRRNMEKKYMK